MDIKTGIEANTRKRACAHIILDLTQIEHVILGQILKTNRFRVSGGSRQTVEVIKCREGTLRPEKTLLRG